jgi:hypothetical protein
MRNLREDGWAADGKIRTGSLTGENDKSSPANCASRG